MEDFVLSSEQGGEILSIATLYKREAKKCFRAKAYLSGCVLMGAAMEALLFSAINCFPWKIASVKCAPKSKGEIKRLDRWTFSELLAVAIELNLLPSGLSSEDKWSSAHAKIGDYANLVRKIRNLIHPVRYVNDFSRKRVTKKYLEACFVIVDAAADYLYLLVSTSLKIMLEEKERRSAHRKLLT